jgi:UDP-glucuronate 4-epimerase
VATTADVRNLEQAVGFSPRTRVEEGIARFVAWYREYYRVGEPVTLPTEGVIR